MADDLQVAGKPCTFEGLTQMILGQGGFVDAEFEVPPPQLGPASPSKFAANFCGIDRLPWRRRCGVHGGIRLAQLYPLSATADAAARDCACQQVEYGDVGIHEEFVILTGTSRSPRLAIGCS